MVRFFLSIIFLGAALMIFFSWTQPNFNKIKLLQEEKEAFNNALANSRQLQVQRDEILSQYNSISKNDLVKLDKILPSQMEVIKLVIEIENIAKNHGLSLKNISVDKPAEQKADFGEEKKNFNTVPLRMTVVGSYESFSRFLADLERNLSLIDINQLTFNSGPLDFYEFNIKASTYYLKK